jgi:hypothetical protein
MGTKAGLPERAALLRGEELVRGVTWDIRERHVPEEGGKKEKEAEKEVARD